jgi:pimeloyl-ACP methyl ester carboxylesterase
MTELRKIAVAPHLVFDALVGEREGAPLVLLLHGFPESMHMWRAQVPALASAGYLAVAPNQRGYSAGARPDATDVANYQFDLLVDDAMAIAAASGHREGRFHLVGHDWGGAVAWGVANRYPERLASLTVLSRPHPQAFARALALPDGDQAHRSRHHKAFLDPATGGRLLANGARGLRERLAEWGIPPVAAEEHVSVLGNPAAIEAALAWYRSRSALRSPLGVIRVPTLYVWGDADETVGRAAA